MKIEDLIEELEGYYKQQNKILHFLYCKSIEFPEDNQVFIDMKVSEGICSGICGCVNKLKKHMYEERGLNE